MIEVEERNGAVIFSVRVAPRGRRDEIEGEFGGAAKVQLKALPVDGKANESLCRFLAECLNVPKAAVRIVAGETSRSKRVQVMGKTRAEVLAALSGKSAENK
ncbi:MAG TPA: DUF167 domain-containing protein [Candidatus Acidoferrum sp.]|nr:DUF167 domain-containing protein [Candidatus Acidoferrum sp.]